MCEPDSIEKIIDRLTTVEVGTYEAAQPSFEKVEVLEVQADRVRFKFLDQMNPCGEIAWLNILDFATWFRKI
jgi:hypothetical protein